MANTKKPTSTKRKSPTKKAVAGSGTSKNTNNGKMLINNEQSLKTKRQIGAIVLFASAIFILCVSLIPGGNVWEFMQNVLFGLFGFCAFIWPLLLFYIAIMASMDKPMINLKYKVIEATVLIFFICGAIHIFSSDKITTDLLQEIGDAYNNGLKTTNGGAIGALIGGVLLILFSSKTAAGVTICILIFIALMILTGTTLMKLFKSLWSPVKKAGEYTSEQMERTAKVREEKAIEKAKFNPDVDLGPDASKAKDIFEEIPEKVAKVRKKKPPEEEIDELLPVVKATNTDNDIKSSVQLDDIIKKAANPEPAVQSNINLNDYFSTKDPNPIRNYKLPPIDCLNAKKILSTSNYNDELKINSQRLVDTLKSFGVETKIVDISRGPSVTRYELQPAAGVKISRITGLADDIALNLAASGVRIEAPIPNKAAVGIEVPNKTRSLVALRELIEDSQYINAKSKLTVALGKDIAGNNICTDLAKMPHLLIAGTTGSGKSVCLNSMILSILFNATPDEVKLVMIDPKQVEFTIYNGIPHLLIPVVSDPRKASGALSWAVTEMLNRYKTFSERSVRDIYGYNELCKNNSELQKMPQILIFIDELSDLMMAAPNEVEDSICRLAQMARAAGMHLVIATQRPSVDVITGIIKANIPSRIALSVSSQVDSRTIIDMVGAEKLLGNGDMLFYPVGIAKPIRVQGCFITDKEVENVVDFLKSQDQTEYDEEVVKEIERQAAAVATKKKGAVISSGESSDGDADELLSKAIEVVVETESASTTLMQRKLKVGYARAARIIDELEERGIVGPFEGSKPRKVLITKQQWFEMNAMSSDIASSNGE